MEFTIELINKPSSELEEIIEIQKSFEIVPRLLKEGVRESESGFLISAHKKNDFEHFLSDGASILVAKDNSKKVVGYLLSYSGKVFQKGHTKTNLEWMIPINQKYQGSFNSGDFTYLDQIGANQAFHGSGVAKALLNEFEKTVKTKMIFTAVVQIPIKNVRSTMFFEKNGYKTIGIFETHNWKNLDLIQSRVFIKEKI